MSFGRMPIANGFLTHEQFGDEYFFNLKVGICTTCKMVQLIEQLDPQKLFHEEYAYFSSISTRMAEHFRQFADLVKTDYLESTDPFVVEVGSNDGIMLQHFASAGIRHLGIEPSANVAKVALDKGIHTVCEFFDEDLAHRMLNEHGQVDAVLGANVMCHVPDLHSVAEGVRLLLKPHGVLIFEDPYLGDIVEGTSYDQIYDEHVFYFSLASVSHIFEQHGLELVDVMPQNVHGGSMRYVIAHQGSRESSQAVAAQRAKEQSLGLHRPETFHKLRENIELSRDEIMALLYDLKSQGQRVVGYGAISKSTTVTNFCGITPDLVEFISDTTPDKQGKYSPGAHIPIRPHEECATSYPDYALLFAWNHGEEIIAKEGMFQEAGGKWIVYVPKVQVLGL